MVSDPVPSFIRCEPGEGKHVFEGGVKRECDCGLRSWPPNHESFVIPEGEVWAMVPRGF